MRVLMVLTVLLVSGCATGVRSDLSGDQMKNGSPIRFERIGSLTSEDLSEALRCRPNQVNLCSGGYGRDSCRCHFVNDAEVRIRQIVGQRRASGT